jgi:hypothetical protein
MWNAAFRIVDAMKMQLSNSDETGISLANLNCAEHRFHFPMQRADYHDIRVSRPKLRDRVMIRENIQRHLERPWLFAAHGYLQERDLDECYRHYRFERHLISNPGSFRI